MGLSPGHAQIGLSPGRVLMGWMCLMVFPGVLVGCGANFSNQPFEEDALYQAALPSLQQLNLEAPEAEESSTEGSSVSARSDVSAESECDPDSYRQRSLERIQQVNQWIFEQLETLDRFRSQAPTERGDDYRLWGPYFYAEGGFYVQLQIIRYDGLFEYHLRLSENEEGVAEGDILMTGYYWPGSVAEEGRGRLVYDWDVLTRYNPEAARTGTMVVAYDTRGEVLDLTLEAFDFGQVDGSVADQSYAYLAPGDDSAYFYYTRPANVVGDEAQLEQVAIWSLWEPSGKGRSEVLIAGGDLTDYEVLVSEGTECWDPSGEPTFYANQQCGSAGDSSLCSVSPYGWNVAP